MKNEENYQKNLAGKTVVITGSSSGVGRAAAEAFAREGCNVVMLRADRKVSMRL